MLETSFSLAGSVFQSQFLSQNTIGYRNISLVCDSFVRPASLARVCDECNYGSNEGRCVICGGQGIADAYYCKGCTLMEKDREGCPKIVNLGSAKTDLYYERKKYGFKNR